MGLGKGGSAVFVYFTWIWFLCLFFCVFVEVVNGSAKRGISCFCLFYLGLVFVFILFVFVLR